MSGEYPLKVNQHAKTERDAFKILIKAYSELSCQEKIKILSVTP